MGRDNGDIDIAVDIPIHHSSSSTTTTNQDPKTTKSASVYPDLKQREQPMEEDHGFTDVAAEVRKARMNEAISKMAELGFEGDWVKTLLESVNCDIAQAVEKMTPK